MFRQIGVSRLPLGVSERASSVSGDGLVTGPGSISCLHSVSSGNQLLQILTHLTVGLENIGKMAECPVHCSRL